MISEKLAKEVLDVALSTGGDFAEIFAESTKSVNYLMNDGKVTTANSGNVFGVGIRILNDFDEVYGIVNDVSRESLLSTAKELAKSFDGESKNISIEFSNKNIQNNHKIKIMPTEVSKEKKIEIMMRAHNAASNYDEVISQVTVGYGDNVQEVLIANSEGTFVKDTRVRGRLSISVIASKDGVMQTGYYGPGAHKGFEFFEDLDVEYYATEAARIAKTMIEAEECPSKKMPVIIDNKFGGVIFHEACGHPLEATGVAKGLSVFTGKLGEKIANDIVTAIDDGTISNAWGSSNVDDEGTPTKRNVLIENGILKSYMIDKLNARKMNAEITGSARRQSYRYAPTSRMTNTFIDNGESTVEEIIKNTEYGLYAKQMGGGSVDPATGDFNFSVMEGYIIENGEIKYPVRGATLVGNGANVLLKIDMIANNLSRAQGMCGSISGAIPADVGQPTLRVSSMTVGGRGEAK